MTDSTAASTSPGRRAPARSTLAQGDLARRIARLPVPAEARARLARFVEDEVHAALEARAAEGFTAAEVEAAGGDAALLERLEKRRADREKAQALRAAGLHALSADALAEVVERARTRQGS